MVSFKVGDRIQNKFTKHIWYVQEVSNNNEYITISPQDNESGKKKEIVGILFEEDFHKYRIYYMDAFKNL